MHNYRYLHFNGLNCSTGFIKPYMNPVVKFFHKKTPQFLYRTAVPHVAECVGFEPTCPKRTTAFRVFYSQHTLADFEKKCPILREKALVRKKMIFSPLRLFPTVRNTRELSERTNRTAIKHNNRKSPLNQWFSELRQLKRSFDFECVM